MNGGIQCLPSGDNRRNSTCSVEEPKSFSSGRNRLKRHDDPEHSGERGADTPEKMNAPVSLPD
jgi:hypothetical protein